MLVCKLLDERLEPTGDYKLAVDSVGAGAGEDVLILDEGNSARQIVGLENAPIRTLVVGIIDRVDVTPRLTPRGKPSP